jgi:hypothetical protein
MLTQRRRTVARKSSLMLTFCVVVVAGEILTATACGQTLPADKPASANSGPTAEAPDIRSLLKLYYSRYRTRKPVQTGVNPAAQQQALLQQQAMLMQQQAQEKAKKREEARERKQAVAKERRAKELQEREQKRQEAEDAKAAAEEKK